MRRVSLVIFVCLGIISLTANAQSNTTKPWVFWYWMQGGVSKKGITADLEAMKQNGIAGAYLMPIKGPANPPVFTPAVNQLTPEFWDMVKFAMSESKRLKLEIGMHVSDGFALAGGPWIKPEQSMQKVVWSKLKVSATNNNIKLPQPLTHEGFYKDIAVYAYPTPAGEGISSATLKPRVTSEKGEDLSRLIDEANQKSFATSEPTYIQYEFEKPFVCRSIWIKTGTNNYQAERLKVLYSVDGKAYKTLEQLEAPRHGWQDTDEDYTYSVKPTTAKYFRLVYDKAGSEPGAEDLDAGKWKPSLKVLNLQLSSEAAINQYQGKNGSVWRIAKRTTSNEIPASLCVPKAKMINLTAKLKSDGTLDWTAPAGNWTILRIGHTSTGHKNETAGGGKGLESDKFSPEAVMLQFNSWYGEAIKQVGPELAKEVLSIFHVDSWECGSQNWSGNFASEFKLHRGYDLTPYLPIMTGLPVESASVSESFLYDVRKTISELVVDKFYKTLASLAKEKGVAFTAESIAPTMLADGLLHYKTVDVPMGEFWLNSPTHDKPNDVLDAISAGHIYGKNIIQAEAFTTVRMDWNENPRNMKTLQDRNYALGINKLVYHVFTHNPWIDRKPGMTLDGVGLYFQRDQTWWKQSKAWVDYAERCQILLQKGEPVADIAVFTGEELPRRSVLPDRLVPLLPGIFGDSVVKAEAKRLANVGEPLIQKPAGVSHSANMADPENWVNPLRGYAYDSFNPDALETATVKNGKVVFASGKTYAVLVFPGALKMNPNYQYTDYKAVKKMAELLRAGAQIIVGDKPLYQSGLQKVSDVDFNKLINSIWGVSKASSRVLGKGKIYYAPIKTPDFSNLGIRRDLVVKDAEDAVNRYASNVAYTHRSTNDQEIYFIANQENKTRSLKLTFRQFKGIPVVYNPVTDTKTELKQWTTNTTNGTSLELTFAPNESLFVVFSGESKIEVVENGKNVIKYTQQLDLSSDWKVQFNPEFGGPKDAVQFKALTDWTLNQDSTIKYYSGSAVYTKSINYQLGGKKTFIDLGSFTDIASVKVNGVDCGTIWTAPFQTEITKALKAGNNTIEIEVTNTWANRLIGDSKLPQGKRITNTTAPFRLEGKPLNPAGLIGPVLIKTQED